MHLHVVTMAKPNQSSLSTRLNQQNKNSTRLGAISILAERRGFEPPIGFPILAFQAGTLDHSDTSPQGTQLF